ncbi:dermonecrotic toxin domain-containing protein [Pseudomonas poae]|uniref:Dermonecrotic toxin N-terminal domain-containing protein n=1 Tax=Pseudomonas poae TaxID=200451 RepID=A0ABY0S4P6_9PSED|nr:DUF6543 domain-containing protein [Pseudomonas poae]SDO80748.1 hypothetical protein SAMN04490208_5024 [Pseudomonas poae]
MESGHQVAADEHTPRQRGGEQGSSLMLDHLMAIPRSSRQLNELYLANSRCERHIHLLQQAQRVSPRISRLIRQTLRDTFQMDPDALLLNVPLSPDAPRWNRNLTDTVMRLLAERACISKGQLSEQACQARQLADDVLGRVLDVDLLKRIESSVPAAWQALSSSGFISRRDRWCELHGLFIADQAVLVHGLNQLSDAGLAMIMAMVEAPTPAQRARAGGEWAHLRVAQVVCPGQLQGSIPFSGALHLYYDKAQDDARQVLFLPGLTPVFYEFETRAQWQQQFPALVSAHVQTLWPLLALRRRHELPDVTASSLLPFVAGQVGPLIVEDAIKHSATALLDVQWDNELAALMDINIAFLFPGNAIKGAYMSPSQRLLVVERGRSQIGVTPGLKSALAQLLVLDQKQRHLEISFASLSRHLPLRIREMKQRLYERALGALLDPHKPEVQNADYVAFTAEHSQWLALRAQGSALLEGSEDSLHDQAFWDGNGADQASLQRRLLSIRGAALIKEAQLQYRLQFIDKMLLDWLSLLVDKPLQWRNCGFRVLSITVGAERQPRYRLQAAFVLASDAVPSTINTRQAVVLYVPGVAGGLQRFRTLALLERCVQASFKSAEPGGLWQCMGRSERNAARAWARGLKADEPMVLTFEDIEGEVLLSGLNEQINGFTDARQKVQQGAQVFTEITDAALATTLLSAEFVQSLQVPASEAREVALAQVQTVMIAAGLATKLPAWHTRLPASKRRSYQRHMRHLHRSELNLQRYLITQLGDVETFARPLLIRQLTADGFYPELDIDKPLFDIPDDVSSVWASHPERTAGESGPKIVVSKERSTFSFMQLALSNLDPQAPWTRWRLNHTRYLDPAWSTRLNVDYLIKTISALDIGGQYDRKVLSVCYGEGDVEATARTAPLLHELLRRPVQRQTRLDLISAEHLNLSEYGVLLFKRAVKAKKALRLCFLRLEALTVPWARHVAGIVAIQDREGEQCLLYWPGQSDYPALSEYPNRDALLAALMMHLQPPEKAVELARHIAPDSEFKALAGYPGGLTPVVEPQGRWRSTLEQLNLFALHSFEGARAVLSARRLYRWFESHRVFPATALPEIQAEILEQQKVAPSGWLALTETDAGNMVGALAHAQVMQVQRQGRAESNAQAYLDAYREWRLGEQADRRVRGFLSLIPFVSIGVLSYEALLAARRLYHSGTAENALDLVITLHQVLLEMAMTFMSAKSAQPGKVGAQASASLLNKGLRQLRRHHRRQGEGAVRRPSSPMTGKGLEPYRISGAVSDAIELKRPHHKGSLIKNAEQFVVDAKGARYGVYQRKGEQQLRLKNRQTPGENELFLFIEEPREWLLEADAPEPTPGPSSRSTPLWQAPPTPLATPVSWSAPPAASAIQLARRARHPTSAWREWGRVLDVDNATPVSPGSKLYNVQGAANPSLKIGERFYETLPSGSQAHPNVVFINPPGSLFDSVEGVGLRLGDTTVAQPVLFTFSEDLRWTSRAPLFSEPLSTSIKTGFPDMTSFSAQQAAYRLVELADSGRQPLTTTRLLNIRAALDRWTPVAAGLMAQTDDLLKMLRPMRPRRMSSLYVGVDGEAGGFERIDFYLPQALDASLFSKPKGRSTLTLGRSNASADAAKRVLQSMGFQVEPLDFTYTPKFPQLLATHPSSTHLYYIVPKWMDARTLTMKYGRERLLSDAWLQDKSAIYPRLLRPVMAALKEGRLVKLFAGIQSTDPATVYFLRPADL